MLVAFNDMFSCKICKQWNICQITDIFHGLTIKLINFGYWRVMVVMRGQYLSSTDQITCLFMFTLILIPLYQAAEFSFHVLVYLFLYFLFFYWKQLYGPVISTLTNTLCNYLDMHFLLIICDSSVSSFLYYYEITKYGACNFAVDVSGVLRCAGLLYESHSTWSMKCCKVDLLCSSWKCNQS